MTESKDCKIISFEEIKKAREIAKQTLDERLISLIDKEDYPSAMLLPGDPSTFINGFKEVSFRHDGWNTSGILLKYCGSNIPENVIRTLGEDIAKRIIPSYLNGYLFFVKKQELLKARLGKNFAEIIERPVKDESVPGRITLTPSPEFIKEYYPKDLNEERNIFRKLALRRTKEVCKEEKGSGLEEGTLSIVQQYSELVKYQGDWKFSIIRNKLANTFYERRWKIGKQKYQLIPGDQKSELSDIIPVMVNAGGHKIYGIIYGCPMERENFSRIFGLQSKKDTLFFERNIRIEFMDIEELQKANLYDHIIAAISKPEFVHYYEGYSLCPSKEFLKERGHEIDQRIEERITEEPPVEQGEKVFRGFLREY